MKTQEEIEKELVYQENMLKKYPIGSTKYLEIKNIINTLEWVLKCR